MRLTISSHPIVLHKTALLRDKATSNAEFRTLAKELASLLVYDAARELPTEQVSVETPLGLAVGRQLTRSEPVVIPVLRAGLGMLDGALAMLPGAKVGFVGIRRDELTLKPDIYMASVPEIRSSSFVLVVDPMIATGGTLIDTLDYLFKRGITKVTCVSFLAAPEGLERIKNHVAKWWAQNQVHIVLGSLDERLNEQGFIVPGLGDAGDRLYGGHP
jgi:uracil phosphoribosyltransferase